MAHSAVCQLLPTNRVREDGYHCPYFLQLTVEENTAAFSQQIVTICICKLSISEGKYYILFSLSFL